MQKPDALGDDGDDDDVVISILLNSIFSIPFLVLLI